MTEETSPKKAGQASVIAGTLAQLLGGSLASMIVIGLSSFDIYMKAGFESAFGTFLGIVGYLGFRALRRR